MPQHDMMVVRENEGTSFQEKGLWDQGLDVPSFLEKALLSNKGKEKFMSLEEDRLVQDTMRQLGQALAASCLVVTKFKQLRGSADKKSHEVAELHQRVENLHGELQRETVKLQEELLQSKHLQQEVEALLNEKSKEVLSLSEERTKLLAEVERLKEELAQKDEELAKEKKVFTNDVANSYLVGFKDVVAQASSVYPEMNFSQLGLGKSVVDGQIVEE